MVQGDSQDTLKKKVAEVKEVVPGWSKNDITLVLTHFNHNVEETIHAFLEKQAEDILRQWHLPSPVNKPSGKKKKKNKPSKEAPAKDTTASISSDPGTTSTPSEQSALEQRPERTRRHRTSQSPTGAKPSSEEATAISTSLADASESAECSQPASSYQSVPEVPSVSQQANTLAAAAAVTESTESSNSVPSEVTMDSGGDQQKGSSAKRASKSSTATRSVNRPRQLSVNASQNSNERTISERSTGSASSKKPHGGFERCYKDLQRQTSSLQRHKLVFSENMTKSLKELPKIFDQLKEELTNREVFLMSELNKEKIDGENWLNKRYQTALELKQGLDKVPSMKESDVINLRAEIKHFVSERRIDEDIASTKRFTCDLESLRSQIKSFGQVIPIKAAYTTRHPSVSSVTSSITTTADDVSSPTTPQPTSSQNPLDGHHSDDSHSSPAANDDAVVPDTVPATVAKVISQSESLTLYEQRNPEDQRPSSSFTRPGRGRGQNYFARGQGPRGRGQRGRPMTQQVPREQGSRSQGPRGQGPRGQGPRDQGPRGQRPETRYQNSTEVGEQQNGGKDQSAFDKQDVTRRARNARNHEQQQETNREGHVDHGTSGAEGTGGSPQRSGRNHRNSSPRKRSGKGQGQANKPSDHMTTSQETNGQQSGKLSGQGDQGQDIKRHDDQSQDVRRHNDQGLEVKSNKDEGHDVKSHDNQGHNVNSHGDQGHNIKSHDDQTVLSQNQIDPAAAGKVSHMEYEIDKKDNTNTGTEGCIHSTSARNNEAPSLLNGHTQEQCSNKSEANKANSLAQRSVVVSVKEQTDGSNQDNDDGLLSDSVVDASVIHSEKDFNVNGLGKHNVVKNGVSEQMSTVKKATVSVEKLSDITRATISVDGDCLSSNSDILPQRKEAGRRRDRRHVSGGEQTDELSTNGVCDVSS